MLDEEEEEWEDGLVEQQLVEVEVQEELGLAVAIVEVVVGVDLDEQVVVVLR